MVQSRKMRKQKRGGDDITILKTRLDEINEQLEDIRIRIDLNTDPFYPGEEAMLHRKKNILEDEKLDIEDKIAIKTPAPSIGTLGRQNATVTPALGGKRSTRKAKKSKKQRKTKGGKKTGKKSIKSHKKTTKRRRR